MEKLKIKFQKRKNIFQKPIDKSKKELYNSDSRHRCAKHFMEQGRNVIMATAKKQKTSVPVKLDADGRKQALATAMSQIERDFGAG